MSGMDLVGATEIAAMLGVTRQRVQQLARAEGFPKPIAVLQVSRTKIWLRSDIEAWMEARKRGRDRS